MVERGYNNVFLLSGGALSRFFSMLINCWLCKTIAMREDEKRRQTRGIWFAHDHFLFLGGFLLN